MPEPSDSASQSADGAPASVAYKGYLDPYFDQVFDALELDSLPWVGRHFRASPTRTIILGESIYAYKIKNKAGVTRTKVEGKTSLRERHLSHGIEAKYKSAYVRSFERAVFLKLNPSPEERRRLWSEVIYWNLAPGQLAKLVHRPTDDCYQDGWGTFLKLTSAVTVTRCIIYGLEKRKVRALLHSLPLAGGELLSKKNLPAVGAAIPVEVSIQLAGRQVDLLFIGHPSRAFSWRNWGQFLRDRGVCLAQQETVLQAIYREHEDLFKRLEDA